jgi:hypothetical protein
VILEDFSRIGWFPSFLLFCSACGKPPIETIRPKILLRSIDALRAGRSSFRGKISRSSERVVTLNEVNLR